VLSMPGPVLDLDQPEALTPEEAERLGVVVMRPLRSRLSESVEPPSTPCPTSGQLRNPP
jgi:hypothetical protein